MVCRGIVQIDHVHVIQGSYGSRILDSPYRKMKRIIASPRLCTLLDISVHRALDSDILMPKGSATDPDMYCRYLRLYMQAHVHVYTRRGPNIYIANHPEHLLIIEDEPPYASHDMSTKLDRVISNWSCGVISLSRDHLCACVFWIIPAGIYLIGIILFRVYYYFAKEIIRVAAALWKIAWSKMMASFGKVHNSLKSVLRQFCERYDALLCGTKRR